MLERLFYKVLSYGNVGKVILQSTVMVMSTKYCLMVMLERLFYKVLSYGKGKVILQSTVLW